MKFGVREICDVVFKAKTEGDLGKYHYVTGQPVLYIDSAKASTLESASTTVYAQGGRGNARLVAWEGEKTLTFTVEDALLSPIGFAILSGAGLLEAATTNTVKVHCTSQAIMTYSAASGYSIDLSLLLPNIDTDKLDASSPIFVMKTAEDGSLTGLMYGGFSIGEGEQSLNATSTNFTVSTGDVNDKPNSNQTVFVDYYVERDEGVQELTIGAENFAGYYYVEASTLFRRQYDGVDLPAEITFPNVKIQSNFTFSMASSGDPSTFTFTMDAMPGYTMQELTKTSGEKKKVLCAIQIVEEDIQDASALGRDSIKD